MEQVNGTILIPASAMVEMSAAAAGVLSDGEAAKPLLAHLSISTPLVLPAVSASALAVVKISPAGRAEILSETAPTRQAVRLHCSCIVAQMPLQQELASQKRQAVTRTLAKVPASHARSQAVMAVMTPLQSEQVSGFCLHPAILDATLHLSAAALPTSTSEAAITRVPTGISALSFAELKQGDTPVPLAQPSGPQRGGSVLCQYKLRAGSKCSVQVRDLLAKQARPLPSAKLGASTGSEDIPMSELLYETQWQVTTSASRSTVPQQACFALTKPMRHSVKEQLAAAFGRAADSEAQLPLAPNGLCAILNPASSTRHKTHGIRPSMQAVSAMLELWQTMFAQCHDKSVSLLTKAQLSSDAAGSYRDDVAPRAAVSALMRVAAAESPGVNIACTTSDPLEAKRQKVIAENTCVLCLLARLQNSYLCFLLLGKHQSGKVMHADENAHPALT